MFDESDVPRQELPESSRALHLAGLPDVHRHRVGAALLRRRSVLRPRGAELSPDDLAQLFAHGLERFLVSRQVADDPNEVTDLLVSFGSAIDVYVLIYRCLGLPEGIYAVDPRAMSLNAIRLDSIRDQARDALLAHPDPVDASATIVLTADFPRYRWRYRHERALRTLWVEAGRMMQELLVAASALDLSTGITPAVSDSLFLQLLGRASDCQVLHTMTVAGPPHQ